MPLMHFFVWKSATYTLDKCIRQRKYEMSIEIRIRLATISVVFVEANQNKSSTPKPVPKIGLTEDNVPSVMLPR